MDNSQQKSSIRPKVVKAMVEDFKKNPLSLNKLSQSLIRGESEETGCFKPEAARDELTRSVSVTTLCL
jgi:hypothetical protein